MTDLSSLIAHLPNVLAASSQLLPAREQMAFTLGFHIILACIGVAFPAMMLIANWIGLKRGDDVALARPSCCRPQPDGVHARLPHHPGVHRGRLPGDDADRQLDRAEAHDDVALGWRGAGRRSPLSPSPSAR